MLKRPPGYWLFPLAMLVAGCNMNLSNVGNGNTVKDVGNGNTAGVTIPGVTVPGGTVPGGTTTDPGSSVGTDATVVSDLEGSVIDQAVTSGLYGGAGFYGGIEVGQVFKPSRDGLLTAIACQYQNNLPRAHTYSIKVKVYPINVTTGFPEAQPVLTKTVSMEFAASESKWWITPFDEPVVVKQNIDYAFSLDCEDAEAQNLKLYTKYSSSYDRGYNIQRFSGSAWSMGYNQNEDYGFKAYLEDIPVSVSAGIKLDTDFLELYSYPIAGSHDLPVSHQFSVSEGDPDVIWTSSNSALVTVNSTGLTEVVAGAREGTVAIKATSKSDSKKYAIAVVKILKQGEISVGVY